MLPRGGPYLPLLVVGLLSLLSVIMLKVYPTDFIDQAPIAPNGTPYGIPISQDSIPTLLGYWESIQLTPPQEAALREALDIESPCCGGRVFSCGCEHDRALQGLGKVLITRYGYSPQKVRAEAVLWQRYFFPEYLPIGGLEYLKGLKWTILNRILLF